MALFYAIGILLALAGLAALVYGAWGAGRATGRRQAIREVTGETLSGHRHRDSLVTRADMIFEELSLPPEKFDVQATFLTPEHHRMVRDWRSDLTRLEKK